MEVESWKLEVGSWKLKIGSLEAEVGMSLFGHGTTVSLPNNIQELQVDISLEILKIVYLGRRSILFDWKCISCTRMHTTIVYIYTGSCDGLENHMHTQTDNKL